MNLVHARKTNRLLGKRVEELESHFTTFDVDNRPQKVRSSKSPLKMSGNESTSARSTPTSIARQTELLTPDTSDRTMDSTPIAKETSEEENDELSTTAISTPSTTRHSMSIEQHLQVLQNEAMSDSLPTHSQRDFSAPYHSRPNSNHLYEFNRDFDTHKSPTSSLFH